MPSSTPQCRCTAGAGHDDNPDVGICVGLFEQVEVAFLHLGAPGIHGIRSVEGQGGHAAAHHVQARSLVNYGNSLTQANDTDLLSGAASSMSLSIPMEQQTDRPALPASREG